MSSSLHTIRRLALQFLYQIEARNGEDLDDIRRSVELAAHDPSGRFEGAWSVVGIDDPAKYDEAFKRALGAWQARAEADRLATELSPDWPTHRQPAIDRNILRLAWYEMNSGEIPPKVAVNEAVELAKLFGTERSAPFLNVVLDKMLRRVLDGPPAEPGEGGSGGDEPQFPMGPEVSEPVDFWTSDQ